MIRSRPGPLSSGTEPVTVKPSRWWDAMDASLTGAVTAVTTTGRVRGRRGRTPRTTVGRDRCRRPSVSRTADATYRHSPGRAYRASSRKPGHCNAGIFEEPGRRTAGTPSTPSTAPPGPDPVTKQPPCCTWSPSAPTCASGRWAPHVIEQGIDTATEGRAMVGMLSVLAELSTTAVEGRRVDLPPPGVGGSGVRGCQARLTAVYRRAPTIHCGR